MGRQIEPASIVKTALYTEWQLQENTVMLIG